MTLKRVYRIYDNLTGKLEVPEPLGQPRADQLQGAVLDQLCELAGRTCYDSLGRGRSSADYHHHLVEVNHGSVWEHGVLTFELSTGNQLEALESYAELLARPGVHLTRFWEDLSYLSTPIRFTANLRAIREWQRYSLEINRHPGSCRNRVKYFSEPIVALARSQAPAVLQGLEGELIPTRQPQIQLVSPASAREIYVSLFFTNVSRNFSHELVRHKFQTAISQRSTRYVDESETPWMWHPLFSEYFDWLKDPDDVWLKDIQNNAQNAYRHYVVELENYLTTVKKVDRLTARKQARGAARGVLGGALMTELVFTASVAQWQEMLRQRHNPAADDEMRETFAEVKDVLKTALPDHF